MNAKSDELKVEDGIPVKFEDWWNRQGRLYVAGSDAVLQKAVMKVAELTWYAAKGAK